MALVKEDVARRRRRTPEVAREEILAAANEVLKQGSAAELTVASAMAETEMTRKTFYVHFADLGELIVELVRPLRRALDRAVDRWPESDRLRVAGAAALDEAAALHVAHATLLRAVWRASAEDPAVEKARRDLLEPLTSAGARILRERRGFAAAKARSVATALATMHVHALLELDPDASAARVRSTTAALREIWESVVLPEGSDS